MKVDQKHIVIIKIGLQVIQHLRRSNAPLTVIFKILLGILQKTHLSLSNIQNNRFFKINEKFIAITNYHIIVLNFTTNGKRPIKPC